MRHVLPVVLLLLAAGILVGGFMLWQRRPGRTVVTVNGRPLSAQELQWRGDTLFNDAKRDDHLAVTPDRVEEARAYFAREAAKAWVIKEILLAAAVSRGITVTAMDEKEAIAMAQQKLKNLRGITIDEFFDEGPMPRELKERVFREGLLVNKYIKVEVYDKIKITGQEIKSRTDELVRRNLMETKPGEKPKYRTDHKSVIALIRKERGEKGFRELFKSLFATAAVESPDYPELATIAGLTSPQGPRRGDLAK